MTNKNVKKEKVNWIQQNIWQNAKKGNILMQSFSIPKKVKKQALKV